MDRKSLIVYILIVAISVYGVISMQILLAILGVIVCTVLWFIDRRETVAVDK